MRALVGLGYKLSKANLEDTENLEPETAPEAQGAREAQNSNIR